MPTQTQPPSSLSICLEDLDAPSDDERYLRCVALPGDEPGLGLDRRGLVRWMPDGPTAYELWVSADGRLVVYRTEGAPSVTVRRGGRSLQAPEGSPVLLLDQDLLEVSGRRLRVHIHGETDEVHEPEWLSTRALGRMARAAAAALALGSAVGAAGPAGGAPAQPAVGQQAIEVRLHPPRKAPSRKPRDCKITKVTSAKNGSVLALSCTGMVATRGLRGQLLDPTTGGYLKNGQVEVIKAGREVLAKTRLKDLGGAKKVRFWVDHRHIRVAPPKKTKK